VTSEAGQQGEGVPQKKRGRPPKRSRGGHRRRWRFTRPGILLLLRHGPAHGYELLKGLPAMFPGTGSPDASSIYPVLRGLEAVGAVESYWDNTGPGPARRVYTLTEVGAEELETWRVDLTRELKGIYGFLEEYLATTAPGHKSTE
jgi:PadR family transcriptional regulator PadR